MDYEHTQTGPVALMVCAFFVLITVVTVILGDGEPLEWIVAGAVMLLTLLVVFAFNSLTVTIDSSRVMACFGWGWPKRVFEFTDITAIRTVRNRWWYGCGLRRVPNGVWMFNVWGLDAIELELSSGKKFRIGTDDCDGLNAALARRMPLPTAPG